MLIGFRVTNFRSIRETQTLSMVAATGKELAETNLISTNIQGFDRLVRSAVIYGPNAAGKTNILRALQTVQTIVLESATKYQQGTRIPFVPFLFSSDTRDGPGEFEVDFVEAAVRYKYLIALDAERIYREELTAYPRGRPQRLFQRRLVSTSDIYKWSFSSNLKGNRSVWRDATRPNALFLSTAIQLNNTQLLPVFEWFQKRLAVIVGPAQMNFALTIKLLDEPDGKKQLLPLLKAADLGISDVEIKREPWVPGSTLIGGPILEQKPNSLPSLVRVTAFHPSDDPQRPVGLDMLDESSGTQALFRSAGAWLKVLQNSEVLLFDEIDTSLHPHLTRFLLQLFHRDEGNNAQLLFTTHDTSLLDIDVMRRDQIWFVEKNDKGASHLYPLAEFSPRKEDQLERGYLRGRYGALPILRELPQYGSAER